MRLACVNAVPVWALTDSMSVNAVPVWALTDNMSVNAVPVWALQLICWKLLSKRLV